MNDLPHRDIYSGMVAEELNKEGYFGQEQQLYGFFCLKDGHIALETASNEESCAAKSLDNFVHGYLVSDYSMVKQRVYAADEHLLQNLTQELELKLIEQHRLECLQNASLYQPRSASETEHSLLQFFSNLSAAELQEKNLLLAMLLSQLYSRGQISHSLFLQLHQTLPAEDFISSGIFSNRMYGFAYREQSTWQFYANAYFPTVWQKWMRLTADGTVAVGLLYKDYPSITSGFRRKTQFLADLKTVLNENFLQTLLLFLQTN